MVAQCSGAAVHAYDMPLHILAVFLIAFFSFLGAILPLIAFWAPRLQVPENLLVAGNFFGIGESLCAFCMHHLLLVRL
jgi:solute carrier family 39 (zinc transporter), member 1/2/3